VNEKFKPATEQEERGATESEHYYWQMRKEKKIFPEQFCVRAKWHFTLPAKSTTNGFFSPFNKLCCVVVVFAQKMCIPP
jgi:hypothetical protein